MGLIAYVVWSVIATRSDLQDAQASVERLQRAVSTQDEVGSERELVVLQGHFRSAHRRTGGPLWGAGSLLPWVGDDVSAVRTLAAVGDDLAQGALAEIVDVSATGLADRLVPSKGRVDIPAIRSLGPVVSRAHRNLNEAAGRLNAVDTTSLTRWVGPSYDALASKVAKADTALGAADRAVEVLPTMLGADGPRTYLLMFENNAEIRSTGGLPGSFSVIRTNRGRLSLSQQGVPTDIGKFPSPVLPQSAAEREIYDGQIAEYFQDTNFTPEFPRTAALVREMWKRSERQDLDGVISIDTVSLGYLLQATGPIIAPGGVQLTAANATRELLNEVYFRVSNDAAQNAFFQQVARTAFDKVLGGVASPPGLVAALGQSAMEGRLYVHSFDAGVQRALAGTTVAGEIHGGDPRVPHVGVYLNDATGSKMSYYLRTRVRMSSESCAGDRQQLHGVADLSYTKDAPPANQLPDFVTGPGTFGTPKGEQLVLVRIYGPEGGEVSQLRVGGSPVEADTVSDRGRAVATGVVQLERGQDVRVSWRIRSGAHQDRPARLSVTPGLTPRAAVRDIPSACG